MAVSEGRIPMYIEEGQAVDKLVEEYGMGSVSRRDPDNKGPLLFKLADGRIWEIDGTEVKQVREARDG